MACINNILKNKKNTVVDLMLGQPFMNILIVSLFLNS